MPICIVGDLRDLTAVYMGWLARRRQLDVLELSEDRIGDDWYFGYSDTAPHAGQSGSTERRIVMPRSRVPTFGSIHTRAHPKAWRWNRRKKLPCW